MDLPHSQRRFVRRSETLGGMIRIEMQVTPEEAAVLWSAIDSALEQTPAGASAPTLEQAPAGASMVSQCPDRRRLEAEEQRADAIVDLAQAYLLSNLVLLCSAHHRMIHEGRLESEICEGKIVFVDGRGRALPAVAASAATGVELEELERFLRGADMYVDGSTAPTWDGSRVGIAEALDWMLLAERGLRAA
ncbi:MAG: hypothetical protein R6X02_34655 [Enhygromyxa sp.]